MTHPTNPPAAPASDAVSVLERVERALENTVSYAYFAQHNTGMLGEARTALTDLRTLRQQLALSRASRGAGGEPGWFLPDSALNEAMLAGLRNLMEFARIARWTNAVTRKDGVERTFEADWIKHMRRVDPPTHSSDGSGGERHPSDATSPARQEAAEQALDKTALVTLLLSAMEWGRDHWAAFSMRGQSQREVAEQFVERFKATGGKA